MTEPLHQASDLAAATAKVAHGGVDHGDNDPDATRALLVDKAIRDRAYPPIGEVESGLAMCAGWGPAKARTPITEPGVCTSATVTDSPNGLRVHRCVLADGHAQLHRDGPNPRTARGWNDDAPKPTTVRTDVASVTT